jgi:hypothetical protein
MDKTEHCLSLYKTALASALKKENRQSDAAIADAQAQFDTLTRAGGTTGDFAFRLLYSAFGAQNAKSMTKKVSDMIADELAKANDSMKIETNPKLRAQRDVELHNRLIDACSIEVDGQPLLTEQEKDSAKATLPAGFKKSPILYESCASDGKKIYVEVTI